MTQFFVIVKKKKQYFFLIPSGVFYFTEQYFEIIDHCPFSNSFEIGSFLAIKFDFRDLLEYFKKRNHFSKLTKTKKTFSVRFLALHLTN